MRIADRLHAPRERVEAILRLIQGLIRAALAPAISPNVSPSNCERRTGSTRPCKRSSAIWTCSAKTRFRGAAPKFAMSEEEDISRHAERDPPAARSQARTRLRRWFGRDRLPRCHSAAAARRSLGKSNSTREAASRILVNHSYVTRVGKGKGKEAEREFHLGLQAIRELVDQESRTKGPYDFLKVSSEIVRQQDSFFAARVEYLRTARSQDNRGGGWRA